MLPNFGPTCKFWAMSASSSFWCPPTLFYLVLLSPANDCHTHPQTRDPRGTYPVASGVSEQGKHRVSIAIKTQQDTRHQDIANTKLAR